MLTIVSETLSGTSTPSHSGQGQGRLNDSATVTGVSHAPDRLSAFLKLQSLLALCSTKCLPSWCMAQDKGTLEHPPAISG